MNYTLTCPKCHRTGFTAAGLKRHACKPLSSASTVAASAPKSAPEPATVSLEIVPNTAPSGAVVVVKNDKWRISVDQIVAAHKVAALNMARGLAGSALSGKLATEIKKGLKHGEWLPFVTEHFEPHGISARTLQRHMDTWDHFKAKAAKTLKNVDLSGLLSTPSAEMTEEQGERLREVARTVTAGETANSLAVEYGLKREEKEKGGSKQKKEKPLTPEEQEALLDEEAQSIFKSLTVGVLQAQNEHRELLLRLPSIATDHEKEIGLAQFRDHLKALLGLVDDTLDARSRIARAA